MKPSFGIRSLLRLTRPAALAAVAAVACIQSAHAGYIISSDPAPSSYSIEARARNGRSGFEGVLFTPGNPSPAGVSMNPAGAPAWSYGVFQAFDFSYIAATGTATWKIDFNRDGDFLDTAESVTSVSPTLAGKGFEYVNLFLQGADENSNVTPTRSAVGVTLDNFTLNMTNFLSYSTPNGTATIQLFEHDGAGSYDITATGSFTFTGNGFSDERPRLWIQLGTPVDATAQAPEPGMLSLLGLGLAGLALSRRRR